MQLKKLIEENYTYAALAKQFGLEKITIIKYLGKMVIDIGSFIQQIEELFQKPYNQIVTPVEEQVKEYILNIKSNIKQYKSADDNQIFIDLCHLAEKYCQPYEQLMAKGSLALYKYNRGYKNDAIATAKNTIIGLPLSSCSIRSICFEKASSITSVVWINDNKKPLMNTNPTPTGIKTKTFFQEILVN